MWCLCDGVVKCKLCFIVFYITTFLVSTLHNVNGRSIWNLYGITGREEPNYREKAPLFD